MFVRGKDKPRPSQTELAKVGRALLPVEKIDGLECSSDY